MCYQNCIGTQYENEAVKIYSKILNNSIIYDTDYNEINYLRHQIDGIQRTKKEDEKTHNNKLQSII